MAGLPSPPQVGSPTARRMESAENLPAALRIGSPVIERGTPPWRVSQTRPNLTRKNTSGSDRISQLFPSRSSSIASPSPLETIPLTTQISYPSPPVPPPEISYHIPQAPAPPSFYDDTPNPRGTSRLLNRLTSLRKPGSRGAEYNKLDDEESLLGRNRLKNVDEVDERVGFDLSDFQGRMLMKKIDTSKQNTSAVDAMEQTPNIDEASYVAEYERLEARLGAGMTSVLEVPFTGHEIGSESTTARSHGRAQSNPKVAGSTVTDAQKQAQKTGGIVSVSEVPIDISGLAGESNDFETRSILNSGGLGKPESKKSYFFPPDPDKPSWRPFSMGWPWLSFLVVIALLLSGLQEFVCQTSMRRVRDDPEQGGLISFQKASELTVLAYFTWKYAPVLFFVIYGILWQITDFEVKRLEPFYQLSKEKGATAAESLNMDYLTFMSWLVPLRALRHKQYAVIYVSLATLVSSSLVPVLQSASVSMYPPHKLRKAESIKTLRINPAWSRGVSGSLIFVAICGCMLIRAMRRKSGLLSNPQGIAGVAAMATKSHILEDFRGLDIAPLAKIHKELRHRRYALHKSSLWQGEYIRNSTEKIADTDSDPRPIMLRRRFGVPYIIYMIIFTIALPILLFAKDAEVVIETLPFILTALATIIKVLWSTMNCDIRMSEPFFILSRGKASPSVLTLDYTGTNPIFLPFKALANKHYVVAVVGLGSILAEVLTVCVSGFSVNGRKFFAGNSGEKTHDADDEDDRANTDQTFTSFWTSFVLSLLILFILIGVAIYVNLKRSRKTLPRQVGTMASVLAFIHQSKMLVHFVDTEELTSSQMTKHLERKGKTYGLGWFSGRDHEDHCGIDEEPLLAPYEYGVDWREKRLLPHQIGTWEQY